MSFFFKQLDTLYVQSKSKCKSIKITLKLKKKKRIYYFQDYIIAFQYFLSNSRVCFLCFRSRLHGSVQRDNQVSIFFNSPVYFLTVIIIIIFVT